MMNDGQVLEPSKLSKKVLMRLLAYMKPHKWALIGAFALLMLATSSSVVGPILVKIFIDSYLTPNVFPLGPVLMLSIGYLLLQFGSAALSYFQLILFQRTALKIIQQMRIDVFSKVQHLGLAFFDKTPGGSLISRITNDTEAIKDMFVSVLSTFVQNIIQLSAILIAMFALDARLASFCLALAPIIFIIMQTYRKLSSKVFHLARHRLSLINAKMNESLQGMYLIQAMRQEKRLQKEFSHINQLWMQARIRNVKLNSYLLRPLVDVVYFLSLMLVISFFGFKSFHSVVDIGVLYAFVSYLERFFQPVNEMMQRLNIFQQAIVAAERVLYLLDESEMAPTQQGESDPNVTNGQIVFDNVTFSYDGKTDILKNISFTALPGQTVALVGHTGSGKSSIVNLLMRFYAIRQGSIQIDGAPIEAFSDAELRNRIGLVLQDPFLFVGDVKHNVRLGYTNISDEEVKEATEFVQAHTFIEKLPNQYDEMIGERGATFSSGQRQLLSFARTMAMKPKILVLDEATASIDTETEEAIQQALEKMRKGRTTIAIAHRLSTIQDADLILVLHHGEIVERGNHQSLLAQEGLYHKMYLLQQGVLHHESTVGHV